MQIHQVMCLHSLSKGDVIEGKSTKIAQILDEVIMHSTASIIGWDWCTPVELGYTNPI